MENFLTKLQNGKYVEKSEDNQYRFLYVEEISDSSIDRNGFLTFVLLNPSVAGSTVESDKTIDRVRKLVKRYRKDDKSGYKYFSVINIYPIIQTKVKNKKCFEKLKDENFKFIEKYITENKDINVYVLGYGTKARQDDVNKVRDLLKGKTLTTFFSELSKKGRPFHPLASKKVYSEDGSLHLYNVDELERDRI